MGPQRSDGLSRRWRHRASRALRWLRDRRTAADLAVAVILGGTLVGRFGAEHLALSSATWLLAGVVIVSIGLRRTAPLAVFAAVAAASGAALIVGAAQLAPLLVVVLLAALYTVAANSPRAARLVCTALFEVWAVLAVFRWAPHGTYLPAFLLMSGTAVAALMSGVNQQTRREYLAALEDRAARLERERDQQARLAVAQERTRIAREVHDIVSHSLSVMVALADGASALITSAPDRAGEAMHQTARTGREAIGEMRRMVGTLRADDPEAERHPQPGIAQLEDLVDQARAAGLPGRLTVEGSVEGMPVGAQLAVYRIVQESLTNIRKHSGGATKVAVSVRRREQTVDVEITDDGRPQKPQEAVPGNGIAGMRERVAPYGGSVEAGPGSDGWRVAAHFYLDDAQERR